MALRLSTALTTFLLREGCFKRAFHGGKIKIYTGSQPANADAIPTGSLLVIISDSSGALTAEVLSNGNITLTGGTNGSITSVTINSVEFLGAGAVPFNTNLNTTAVDLATAINNSMALPHYTAEASGAVVTIKALPLTGTTPNGYAVACTVTGDITKSTANLANGVAQINGLKFGSVANGQLDIAPNVWSGIAVAVGTAGWFRFQGTIADDDSASPKFLRLDGNITNSGSNLDMASTAVTGNPQVITVSTFSVIEPAA